ncbi:MAG TPA: membrane protein insertase YidC [Rhizomicrobium sp.]|jgi:YidC/Oxa1 family membrane protein insertase
MENNRNTVLAVVLALGLLLAWEFFVAAPQMKQQAAKQAHQAELQHKQAQQPQTGAPLMHGAAAQLTRDQALKASGARVAIDTPTVDGSILLQGARFDDLRLKNYRETVDPKSPEIVLFSPGHTRFPYFAQYGWSGAPGSHVAVPGNASEWKQTGGTTLSPDRPVTLSWDNGQGLVFTRTISVDRDYMFTIADSVANKSGHDVVLFPYAVVVRDGTPAETHYMALHEGFIGWLDDRVRDPGYDSLKPEEPPQSFHSTAGWLGITDKYWMATLIPPQGQTFDSDYRVQTPGGVKTYQADYRLEGKTIAAGATLNISQRLFAGAKVVSLLENYADKGGVINFKEAVDWGWYSFITKPMFWLLDFLFKLTNNFGLAIILLTVVVRLLFFPIANTQFKSMSKMKKLQPQVEAIKARFAEDKVRQQQEMMDLYKREKANPVSGCLPIVIQIPVFFSLYKVLLVTIEMRHAPFIGWIHDLSAPDPTSIVNLFGLLPYGVPTWVPAFLSVGIWPIIMGFTQYVQSKLNPAPTDPVQARMFTFMPIMFTCMLAAFPAGLVIYYAWSNLLGILQQSFIMSRQGVEIHLFRNFSIGGRSARMAAPPPKEIEGKAKDVTEQKSKRIANDQSGEDS